MNNLKAIVKKNRKEIQARKKTELEEADLYLKNMYINDDRKEPETKREVRAWRRLVRQTRNKLKKVEHGLR